MRRTYTAPGVYVVEDQSTPMPLSGVPTGIPCFFGFTQQGPSLKPTRITSMNEFYTVFGRRIENTTVFPRSYVGDSLYGFFLNGGSACYVCRVNQGKVASWPVKWVQDVVDVKREPRFASFLATALSGGTWANELLLEARKSPADGQSGLFDLQILEPVPPKNPGQEPTYRTLESFPELSTDPDSPEYYLSEGVVNGVSNRIVLSQFEADTPADKVAFGTPLADADATPDVEVASPEDPGARVPAANLGSDMQPAVADYEGFFNLLKEVPDVSLISCPDAFAEGETTPPSVYTPIYQAAINYSEQNRCMTIIDCPPQAPVEEPGDLGKRSEALKTFADRFRSTHAAIYAPWLVTPNLDPTSDAKSREVPPSGFVLGAYNRCDNNVGVWKAPANIPVLGPVGLGLPFTDEESDILNPAGVNLIRAFAGQGILIWGARTTTKNVTWRYVNVRRLFLYIERTLKQQTTWAVFESNDQRTWNKLVNAAENFLRGLWLAGGLMGSNPEEAFRVHCGVPSTMTMTDVENGLLKVEVAIAPVRPAEFVVFTISQLVQTPQ